MQSEEAAADSISQLRIVQEAMLTQRSQFEARLAAMVSEKDEKHQQTVLKLRQEISEFGRKFKESQDVRGETGNALC